MPQGINLRLLRRVLHLLCSPMGAAHLPLLQALNMLLEAHPSSGGAFLACLSSPSTSEGHQAMLGAWLAVLSSQAPGQGVGRAAAGHAIDGRLAGNVSLLLLRIFQHPEFQWTPDLLSFASALFAATFQALAAPLGHAFGGPPALNTAPAASDGEMSPEQEFRHICLQLLQVLISAMSFHLEPMSGARQSDRTLCALEFCEFMRGKTAKHGAVCSFTIVSLSSR